jgi:glycosyltransferase involved in cell wall biosynthesis
MRVLVITNIYPTFTRPASGVFIEQQVSGLIAIGLHVRVLHIDRLVDGPLAYYRMSPKLDEVVEEFNPHLLHVMYGGVMADRVSRANRTLPLAVTFHGSDLLGENLSGLTRKLISRYGVYCSKRAAKRAQLVIVVARHLITALAGCCKPNKIQVVPCGIDLDRFAPMDRTRCRAQLGWNSAHFHVLFASSNGDPVKQPWLAKEAVSRLASQGTRAELHQLTGVSNLEVPTWLNASDALLLTSKHEGSPTIVKEALACSLPVVSVDVGDVAERLDGIDGCHIAQPDPTALANRLWLVHERGRRLECRAALEDLSHIRIAHKLKLCYEKLLQK